MITSQERKEEVLQFHDMGFSNKQIAKELKMSPTTVMGIVGRTKRLNTKNQKVSQDDIAKMRELRGKGLSNAAIGRELGFSDFTVRKYLSKQPDMNRAEYGSLVAHVTGESFVKEEEKVPLPKQKLKLISTTVELEGDQFTYKVRTDGTVRINNNLGFACDFTKQEFFTLITELCEVGDWITSHEKQAAL